MVDFPEELVVRARNYTHLTGDRIINDFQNLF